MNSILLSGLNGTPQSGLDALLNPKAAGARSSFAHLLQQQSDHIDGDLAQWLQSLDLDDPAALFAELKAAGLDPQALLSELKTANVDPNTLQTLLGQKGTALLQRLEKRLAQQNQDATTRLQAPPAETNEDALAFIQSTLFIAQESSSLRQAHAARVAADGRPAPDAGLRFNAQPNTRLQAADFNVNHLKGQLTDAAQPNANLRADASEGRFALNANFQAIAPTEATVHFAPLNLAAPTMQSALNAGPTYSAQIPTPVQHAQWSSDLGRVMVTLTQQAQHLGPQNAEIRLDPPELGPLRIVLSVVDNVAHTTIYAAHAQTRLTVEQALPQLQQQLAQSGLSLGNTDVSDQGFAGQSDPNNTQQQAHQSATFSLNGTDQSIEKGPLAESAADTTRLAPDAIIDTFA